MKIVYLNTNVIIVKVTIVKSASPSVLVLYFIGNPVVTQDVVHVINLNATNAIIFFVNHMLKNTQKYTIN